MNIDSNVYKTLTAGERFRAAVEAFGRKDYGEVDRLNDACAIGQYRQQDPAYFGRLQQLALLALAHARHVEALQGRMMACMIVLLTCGVSDEVAVDDVPREGGGSECISVRPASHMGAQRMDNYHEAANLVSRLQTEIPACEQAFDEFCDRIELRSIAVRAMFGIGRPKLGALLDSDSCDSYARDTWLATLERVWRFGVSRLPIGR